MEPNEIIIRMECLKLACSTAGPSELGQDTLNKAVVFADYVVGQKSTILKPTLVSN